MTAQALVGVAIEKAGGLNKLARLMAVAPNAVAQWRDARALPEWFRANRLSEITGEDLDAVQRALTAAHQERSERRWRKSPGGASSGWKSARRPLGRAGLAVEVLIPAGAGRLRRTALAGTSPVRK